MTKREEVIEQVEMFRLFVHEIFILTEFEIPL